MVPASALQQVYSTSSAAVASCPAGGALAQPACPPLGAPTLSSLDVGICRISLWPLRLLKNSRGGPAWAHLSKERVVLRQGHIGWGYSSAYASGARVCAVGICYRRPFISGPNRTVDPRVPGLSIRDCARGCSNCGHTRPQLSAIDLTEKTFFERLYLVLGLRKIAP